MKSLAWKLATLAAVIGIGFLVLLQAQRGMNQAFVNKQAGSQAALQGAATSPTSEPDSATKNAAEQGKPDAVADAPSQSEPRPTAASSLTPSPATASASPTPINPNPYAGQKPNNTAEVSAASPGGSGSPSANDPFGDMNDAKRLAPAGDSNKTAATPAPDVKQAGDVKQASASGEENTAKLDPPAAKTPTVVPPSAVASAPPAGASALIDPKAPVGQSEPADSTPAERPADQNSASKDTAGPQLLAPAAGQDSPAPANNGSQPQPKTAEQGTASGSPPPPAADTKKQPTTAGPAKNSSEPSPFPSLDDEPGPAPGTPALGKNAPMTPAAAQPAPIAHPDPFPVDPAKEVPLTKAPEPTGADLKHDTRLAAPTSETQLAGPKSADLSASSGSQGAPPAAPALHAEASADVEGDGTVTEQAPLGPQRPQLNIEKVAPSNALIGQPLVYSILVKNVGSSEAHDVVVEDRIPKGTKLTGTIPRAERTGKRLIWRIGNLGPNEQRKISIRVIPLEAGEIGSVATVNFVSEAAAETVVTAPRLEFELSAPRDVRLGQTVPFHFKVKNVGTGEARGVVIRDLIPEGLSHGAGNDLEYEIGRLPPGKLKDLTLDLKATKIGPTVNRAVVVGEGGLSVKAEATIEVSGAKIALSRSGPPRRYLGRPSVYSNTLVNESKNDVENVVAVESVPAGMEFAGASHGGQFNEGTRTIAWRIERMAAGETCVVKSKLIPISTGTQSSTVRVSVPNGEPTEATSQTIVEGFAALGVDVAGADGPVDVGEKVTLHVNVRNKGTIAATNVVVTVDVPDQMAVLSIRGPGKPTQEGNQVKFGPIPMLEGRTAATCELVLQANKRGDSRIHVSLRADQIDKPLTREESVLVLSESSEPAASR
jgi:uncharacterized repeat protein (TIGR01451 family)